MKVDPSTMKYEDWSLYAVINQICDGLGFRDTVLAALLDTDTRTLRNWKGGSTVNSHSGRKKIREVWEFVQLLNKVYPEHADALNWLDKPNKHLQFVKPSVFVRGGGIEWAVAVLHVEEADSVPVR